MNEKVLDNIRSHFVNMMQNGVIEINGSDERYPAFIIKMDGYYGVAVKYLGPTISEKFNNIKLWSNELLIRNEVCKYLMLTSTMSSLRDEFATVCAEFIRSGENGEKREALLNDPAGWWKKWKSLMGNSVLNKKAYSVIAEMETYERLLKAGASPVWGNFTGSTHDLETDDASYEVKATENRYETLVTISSQFQLKENPESLYLIFCRLEESNHGFSIEDKVENLVNLGVHREEIELTLEKLGMEEGSSVRKQKYKLLDIRKYTIDDSFPKVTLDNLNEISREAVKRINYTIDLISLPYSSSF